MGLAEQNAKILHQYLGLNRKPTKREYEKSKQHSIPAVWNPGQSQNWWVLGVGVRMAYGDNSEIQGVINRLESERDFIGTWGSEQHSPIYWNFHVTGRLSILRNLPNTIQGNICHTLIVEQLQDFFRYCQEAMSPNGDEILWCGMRGTGMYTFSSYELYWLYCTYILGQTKPKRKYWKQKPDDYAWLTAQYTGYALAQCKPRNDVMGIRSPTHFMEFGPKNKLVYTEDDQHSSTVFRGAGGILNGKRVAAPYNYAVHNRGAGAGSFMVVNYNQPMLTVRYEGPYNKLRKAKPVVFDENVPPLTKHYVWNTHGLFDVLTNVNVGSIRTPQIPVPAGGSNEAPRERKSFWQRLLDALRN